MGSRIVIIALLFVSIATVFAETNPMKGLALLANQVFKQDPIQVTDIDQDCGKCATDINTAIADCQHLETEHEILQCAMDAMIASADCIQCVCEMIAAIAGIDSSHC